MGDNIGSDDDEDEAPPPGVLSRSERRASISMPQGLDLLLKIAEYNWQSKPPLNSSFDDLAEAGGVPDSCPSPLPSSRRRKSGQVTAPSKSGLNYEPVHSESEEISDLDLSEAESPVEKSPPPPILIRKAKARVGISLDPKGRSSSKKKKRELDDDTEICLKPLAGRRNSGIVPLSISDSNFLKSDPDEETTDDEDKGNSSKPPNGGNKFAKIIKDKLHSVPIPKIFQKRKPKEYKLQVFVAILFLIIILLVGSIYVIHQEKELQKSYFDRIRFSSKDRRIRVSNLKGRDILSGVLGTNLAKKDKAWPCLKQDEKSGHTCLEWMNKARLYFRIKHQTMIETGFSPAPNDTMSEGRSNNLKCYEIYWEAINPNFKLKDCYSLGERNSGHFYGGGEVPGSDHFPLNKTNIPYSPFLTGNKVNNDSDGRFQWGMTLGRFFINSDGAAIQITKDTPLHISINEGGDRKLCLGSGNEGYDNEQRENAHNGDTKKDVRPLHLNYTICTGENALETAELLAHKNIWDGLKHEDLQVARLMAQSPIWRILPETINHKHFSEAALLNYTDRIASILSEGYILLDESWQQRIGDLEMDPTRFPTMDETLNITRRRGFKVALTIQPFFSTQSRNYEEGLHVGGNDGGIWLAEKHPGKNKVPALTQYKNWTSVAVLDCTKIAAQHWLEDKVSAVVDKYRIDALYVDLGTAYDLPQFYEFSKPLSSSDYYKDLFLKALRPIQHVRTIGVSTAVKLPKLPTFVSLSPTESSWEGLRSVIPNILSMGVAGYPFITPGAIGGDFFHPLERSNISYRTSSKGSFRVPDRDLYLRWLELVHFLPVVHYSYLPSDYDQKMVDIATNMYLTRKNKLYPYIKKAIDQSLTTGLPVIRPLWMIDPTDPNCLKVSDEFSIGEDIIVAPVMSREEERDIYLPKGIWRNEMDGSPTKGEKWLHHYRVKEHQIPFFTKMPGANGHALDN